MIKKLAFIGLLGLGACSLFDKKEDAPIKEPKERLPFVEGGSFVDENGETHECPSPNGTCTGEVPPHCHSSAAKCPIKR